METYDMLLLPINSNENGIMLVITRRTGEAIYIGDDIETTILESSTGRVSVGVDAPKEVPVHRDEVWERIQEEENA